MAPRSIHAHLDKIGTGLSLACAMHCLLLPVVVGFLPLLGLGILADHTTEAIFASCTLGLAFLSTVWGLKTHRDQRILLLYLTSAGVVLFGLLFAPEHSHLIYMVVGGLGIAATHIINRKLCSTCPGCHH